MLCTVSTWPRAWISFLSETFCFLGHPGPSWTLWTCWFARMQWFQGMYLLTQEMVISCFGKWINLGDIAVRWLSLSLKCCFGQNQWYVSSGHKGDYFLSFHAFFFILPALLRYNWHIELPQFKVCSIITYIHHEMIIITSLMSSPSLIDTKLKKEKILCVC